MARRREVEGEQDAADRPRAEPGDARLARPRDDQRSEADRRDGACNLRSLGAHFFFTTTGIRCGTLSCLTTSV